MTRVNPTGKESSSNFSAANGTGADVRSGLNNILESLRTVNSAAGDPSGSANLAAYQLHINSSNNLLKIRNSANSGFVVLGDVSQDNLGLLPLTGGTLTGNLQLPNGTSSAPSLNVGVNSGTGLYRSATNTLAFTSGGLLRMFQNTQALTLVGTSTSGAKLRLREKSGEGNDYVQLRCPATLADHYTLFLPTSLQGTYTAGLRVLKTDTNGQLSFQFVDASDLAGTTLAAGVKNSELESVGTLGSLTVTGTCTAGTFSGDGSNLTGISTVPKCESTQLSSTFTNSDNNPLPREEFQTVLSVSIEPSSSSVKLLVMITGRILKSGIGSATNNSNAVFQCFEGTTAIGTEVIHGNSSEEGSMSIDQNILRTPNSENTITYHCKIKSSDDDANVKMLAGATLTVLEVS